MSKRIFITTNWASLNDNVLPVAAPDRNNDNRGINTLSNNNPALYYNANILLHDESYTTTINAIPIEGDDFLLHHSRPNNPTPNYREKFGENKRSGIHQLHDPKYPAVFKIIFDNEGNKAERIIEFLFPSEETKMGEKMDFLHQLLMPANAENTALKNDWMDGKDETVIKETENHFVVIKNIARKNDAPFNPEYMEVLEKLKNSLLQS
jgi:hypothetical protein